ncbi:hypothetical protein RchiOBHm_Chr1g0351171 [Rosa chinensis]|uniref:Uncharacterized protein n=1 Tax=Rosa chinensis TaxID=74649 RepID=A0A2P6SGD4_ROSCH|nr:hypothetical protein RchiOBHm_Chr1g0345091 [Rosa chinensis]PRQ57696.1 hypothetical protein RchiOBHm_Chr1g0351171 [Rosa chinensis]
MVVKGKLVILEKVRVYVILKIRLKTKSTSSRAAVMASKEEVVVEKKQERI